VRGHGDSVENARVDALAVRARQELAARTAGRGPSWSPPAGSRTGPGDARRGSRTLTVAPGHVDPEAVDKPVCPPPTCPGAGRTCPATASASWSGPGFRRA